FGISLFIVILPIGGGSSAQNKKLDPDAGYIPTVAPEDKKKNKSDEVTQALALPPELPAAVTADTNRLTFQVTPLSAKGLLSQQTRNALKILLHSNRGTIVKLRAFVAGSGDLRRIGEIAGEMFLEKHQTLPALTALQVGALPMEGAQVVIEAIGEDRKVVNPYGVAFLAGQAAPTVAESLGKLEAVLAAAGMQPSDALLITCFVSSLEEQRDTQSAMAASFPGAALNYVQMQRAPVTPGASCEAKARMRSGEFKSDANIALVSKPQVVITGMQLAFGNQDGDLKLAFERLGKTLAEKDARLDHAVISHLFVTSSGLSSRVLALQAAQGSATHTLLPVEALPSLDASFGLDVMAVSDAR
ncbi:MAG: RidA family protein, partial [Bryobacterales bacterium]|nr:RidA family protein [Bryobacterales bacterium]